MSRSFTSRPTQSQTRGRGRANSRVRDNSRGRGTEQNLGPGRGPFGNEAGAAYGAVPNVAGKPAVSKESPRKVTGHQGLSGKKLSPEKDEPQRGQHMGAFTMFAPNEQRREQIQNQAKKETDAFDQYKKQNAGKVYHHVGTVGGGEITETQVRNRQANIVKAQKIIRQRKQEELKATARNNEAEEIQKKRMEQRRKAEQNKIREGIPPPAQELRRKRDAFLQQFKSNEMTSTTVQDQLPDKNASARTKQDASTTRSTNSAITSEQSTTNLDAVNTHISELPSFNQHFEMSEQSHRVVPPDENDSLSMLVAMFPNVDQSTLNDLFLQTGSIEAVVSILGMD